jgi:hypothetical protein
MVEVVRDLGYRRTMSTVETEVEIGADGSMKLLSPLPSWVKPGRAHVVLTLADSKNGEKTMRRKLIATPEMIARRKQTLEKLRALGGLTHAIPDPVAWQKELRKDALLPGRD